MINYGEYDISMLPRREPGDVDGLRIAFHKQDMLPALEFCREVKGRGYEIFIQAMVSLSYSDDEFLDLIRRVNKIQPYAFYIVDSFGTMKKKELVRLFYMVEHNLAEEISIGFHSHNNLQLSYSNAQALVDLQTRRDLLIDSSVFGMGRGAGNLNTELLVEYLNDNAEKNYAVEPLLSVIDEVISHFYLLRTWGYSLSNYLSAVHNSHPSYAGYFSEKQTLTFEDMNEIFGMMDGNKQLHFDKVYAEKIYMRYMSRGKVQTENEEEWKKELQGKKVLLIAPGKSALEERERIVEFSGGKDVLSVSINYDYPFINTDFIFLSNLRRYRELDEKKRVRCIVTSNIPAVEVFLKVSYRSLSKGDESVRDNAGLMALRLLIAYGCREIYLAGFDGYSHDVEENYMDNKMSFVIRNAVLDAKNKGMTEEIKKMSKSVQITFLTKPRYLNVS